MIENIIDYESAFQELQQISLEIENEKVSIDDLAAKVKRASELLNYCNQKLKSTEEEVDKIIKQMDSQQSDN